MKPFVYGSEPERDICPGFARFWASLPRWWQIAKGDARREWMKLRPNRELEQVMTDAAAVQSQSAKWQAGYFTTPAKWIRGERWLDPVQSVVPVRDESWRCQHSPSCYNSALCQVKRAREQGRL